MLRQARERGDLEMQVHYENVVESNRNALAEWITRYFAPRREP